MAHKSVPQECPSRRRVASERDDWWYYVICFVADLFSVALTQRERHQEVGAPEPHCCAAVSSAHPSTPPHLCRDTDTDTHT